jgi:hypothetical protein
MSGKRVLVLGVFCGAALLPIYWLPSTAFYLLFQKKMLSHDPHSLLGSVLWARSAAAASSPAGGDGNAGGWGQILHGGVLFPLPPGELRRAAVEGETVVLEMREASLTVDRLPPGSIRRMYASEYERVGGDPAAVSDIDDAQALLLAASATPGDFHFGFSSSERARYAAALLTKLLLFGISGAPAGAAGGGAAGAAPAASISTFAHAELRTEGALLAAPAGGLRALVVLPDAILAFATRGSCPRAWLEEPSRWGEIVPAPPRARELWIEEVRRRRPDPRDPLRVWAEGAGADAPSPAAGAATARPAAAR